MNIFNTLKLLIFYSTLIPLAVFADNKANLIISYGDHNSAPYAIEKGEQLSAGIIKDIATEIAGELDITITFAKTPRKRIERYLESNTIHVELITSPAWLSNSEKLQWSETIFIERDIMVVKADNPKQYNGLVDFRGMIIGTIRGYKYPKLQPFFDKDYFIRYDVSNLNVNFIRLELDRIDALVDADILINYQLMQNKNSHIFKVLPLTVSQQNIRAALSPNAPVTINQFNQALKKLKDQGVIAAILKKYYIDVR
ncbi:substrate-binding periplasmic protein [Colwellia psychrerythraea]|uniref:ABC-type transporter, periplasmic subunit family 3 n=1 Tax=Colwellia psychrerythraea TaxID=28229 RepID=A0A099KHD6_COLPS|nr:transporter substrate-binding domain-containing protein [Colwellia psychrerythraea]KGJ89766.1 ABC-type transporter, periplasmic subunit family 3 [Colwellia psychrerythraea]